MTIAIDKTVRELALENPASTRVFESFGIDYCCGGSRSLSEACLSADLSIDEVLESLAKADEADLARHDQRDWQTEPLAALIEHIQSTHHRYTRQEIARLGPLFEKVCSVHGSNHPELLGIRDVFRNLAQELSAHMMKEEMILFPYSARAGACVSYQTLYGALATFEADLHQHIHLENNILFPRAVAVENGR